MNITTEQLMMMAEDTRDDSIKAYTVRLLVSRLQFNHYKRNKSNFLSLSSYSFQEDSQIYTLRNYSCSPLLLKTIKKNRICNAYKDSEEQYHIIYENFINLYKLYIPRGSRLNNEKPEVYISYIRQFFLDKGLTTEDLFRAVIFACKKEQWVDIKLFTECIETLQVNLFDSMYYFFRGPPSEVKLNIELQKLLCKKYIVFFQFVDIQDKNKLNFLQVCETFRIALKGIKESEVTSKTTDVFQKVNLLHKCMMPYVSFEEFYYAICNCK